MRRIPSHPITLNSRMYMDAQANDLCVLCYGVSRHSGAGRNPARMRFLATDCLLEGCFSLFERNGIL